MNCEKYKLRIADFAAADAAAAFRPADVPSDPDLAAHLTSCTACRTELDARRALLASIDRGLASMVAGEPSGDLAAHVRRRIAQEGVTTRPWFAGWMPLTAAGLALIVLVTFWMLRREIAPPERARETPPAQNSRPPREPQLAQKAPAIPAPSNAGGPHKIRPLREPQSAANREPEVLVPRGEMAAVMRLFNANWEGKADGATLMAVAVPTKELLKPLSTAELKIRLLEIERLDEEGKLKGSSENR